MSGDWDDDAADDFDDHGEDDFDYDEYVREHHQGDSTTALAPIWKATATVLLLMIVAWFLMVVN